MLDDETGQCVVQDNAQVMVGGIVTEKVIKITRQNERMAFLTLEDLAGTVEVLVFPRTLEKEEEKLEPESRIFVNGRVNASDNEAAKLIMSQVYTLEQLPKRVWIRCKNLTDWRQKESQLYDLIDRYSGASMVTVYLDEERAKKDLPRQWRIQVNEVTNESLRDLFGEENIRITDLPLDRNVRKRS